MYELTIADKVTVVLSYISFIGLSLLIYYGLVRPWVRYMIRGLKTAYMLCREGKR